MAAMLTPSWLHCGMIAMYRLSMRLHLLTIN